MASSTRWLCQICRGSFDVNGGPEASAYMDGSKVSSEQSRGPQASVMGIGSILAGSRMDHSFVILPKQRGSNPNNPPIPQGALGASFLPPRPRATGLLPQQSQLDRASPPSMPSGGVSGGADTCHVHGGGGGGALASAQTPPPRTMEDSFVVLPASAASIYRTPSEASLPGGAGGVGDVPASSASSHTSNASLDARIAAMQRVFEMASQLSQIDQPLCLECTRLLCKELEAEEAEARQDTAAYEALLAKLDMRKEDTISEDDFLREKEQLEEEEARLEAELAAIMAEQEKVTAQLAEQGVRKKVLDDREERYWHDFNDFKLQLMAHQEERDAVLTQIDVKRVQLESLKATNVYNDVFHIWGEEEFGTINGFRLGRLPTVHVEWDEINAAWGQACLLLHTMAQACRFTFSYRILPMGSYPRIAENNKTYDLYGPVNLFWSTHYDKAMVLFLACLREFGEFAHARDRSTDVPADKAFSLPYKIEGDKVGGFTIKQSFNREERWTKALKLTLFNLKWGLHWLVHNGVANGVSHPSSPSASLMVPSTNNGAATTAPP